MTHGHRSPRAGSGPCPPTGPGPCHCRPHVANRSGEEPERDRATAGRGREPIRDAQSLRSATMCKYARRRPGDRRPDVRGIAGVGSPMGRDGWHCPRAPVADGGRRARQVALLPSRSMEIIGVNITHDRQGQCRDPLRGLPRGHRGHALARQPARYRRRGDRRRRGRQPGDQPWPVPVPRRPSPTSASGWRDRGFLFCRKGEVREIMRPVPIPTADAAADDGAGASATESIATITSSFRPDR